MSLRVAKPKHAPPSKHTPLHAKPSVASSVATPVVVGGALTAGTLVAGAGAASAASDSQLAALRECESGGNYQINTGNGYYGAYQFSASTWRSLGYSGLPHNASPATQDRAARELQARSGWGQWPACSRKLGLRGDGGQRASRSVERTPRPAYVVPETAPAYRTGMVFYPGADYSPHVKAWQARMAQRGWTIAVDGLFGPQSARTAISFAAEKGLRTALRGGLTKTVFIGAWSFPVT